MATAASPVPAGVEDPAAELSGQRTPISAAARHSVSPNLNTTVTMSPSESRLASPNLDLNATVTVPASLARKDAPSPDLNATVTVPTSQVKKSASPDLNATVTVHAPQARKSASPDLNSTVTVTAAAAGTGRRRSSPVVAPAQTSRRRSPASAAVDLNATRTLSPVPAAVAGGPTQLPSFDSCSPIQPVSSGAALCVPLPPDLPPTPEILRRTRTPLKSRAAAQPPPHDMDSTFTMEAAPFRVPLATPTDGGGRASAGGGGQRALAGKGGLSVPAGGSGPRHGAHRTGTGESARS